MILAAPRLRFATASCTRPAHLGRDRAVHGFAIASALWAGCRHHYHPCRSHSPHSAVVEYPQPFNSSLRIKNSKSLYHLTLTLIKYY